jgi:lipoprotein signal peptidase
MNINFNDFLTAYHTHPVEIINTFNKLVEEAKNLEYSKYFDSWFIFVLLYSKGAPFSHLENVKQLFQQ